MRRAAVVLLALAGAAAPLAGAPAPDPKTLLKVSARLEPAGSVQGTLLVRCELASGWHVNSHTPSEDYLIPTEVEVAPAPGATIEAPKYPEGKEQKFSFSDKPLSVYAGSFSVEVPVSWKGGPAPELSGVVKFQACSDTQCLAPTEVPFRVSGAAPGAPPASGGTASAGSAAPLAGGAVPLSEAKRLSGGTAAAGASQDFGKLLESRGYAGVLVLLFGWGLALNLTPCVYPVIPLTVSFFGGQAAGNSRRTFALASVYVLGMATTYSALGVAAALSGRLFGVALQSPWVLAGIAAVLVALALSMFGLYDLRMPTALMQKAGARQGVTGAYAMGLLVGVVAAPCVGPVVLGLLAFVAATQNAALGFLFFFVLSLGLGLPFLFLAAFSGRIAALPRAGAWMEGVKKIFGWVLLAMAAYFLRNALPAPYRTWLLPAVLAVGAAALVISRIPLRLPVRALVAIAFLAAAVFFSPLAEADVRGPAWEPFDATRVGGRPAVIDFSASWCLPCIELDKKTFSDARVRQALERRALYRADMTKAAAPETVALADKYRILGVPTIIFLDASGNEIADLRLVGFEEPNEFLKRLEKAP
jgi:thiol:disulfide interchange protein DsbD